MTLASLHLALYPALSYACQELLFVLAHESDESLIAGMLVRGCP